MALFKDKSSIVDGTESNFTYSWDFGDQFANAQHPNTSGQKNPSHAYTVAANYDVKLTVTSINGCPVTLIKPFTVNGSTPKAQFNILNSNKLCSIDPVIFEDKATVDFGQITSIEWYFDYTNDPNTKVLDDHPNLRGQTAKQYSHQYPVFHTPLTKIYNVRMVAYSGATCISDLIIPVTLHAVPEVQFDVIPGVCEEKLPYQITQAQELHTIPGIGEFTGDGISSTGIFDPAKAGIGPHTLTYTYMASNGCTDYKTQDIMVYPTPKLDAGPDQTILDGGQIQLQAKALGENIKYKWTPSRGLDRDDILNPIASPETDMIYILTITSDKDCSVTDDVFVKVLSSPSVPNTFTPNGDGINDEWDIKYLNTYPDATVEIYNRYGEKVFTSSGYPIPWNGRYNNIDLPVGTYYYIVNPRNGRKLITGSVTILR